MSNQSKKLLADVAAACAELQSFLSGIRREVYQEQALIRRGVEREIEIIGEALAQLRAIDPETFTAIPAGPRIVGMRNRLIHGYAHVSDDIVWDAAQRDIPLLLQTVEALLRA